MTDLLTPIQAALDLPQIPLAFTEAGALPSAFAVTELASASLGAAGQAVAQLIQQQTGRLPNVSVDRRLASFWFSSSIRPVGWQVPPLWDPVAVDYASADALEHLGYTPSELHAIAPGLIDVSLNAYGWSGPWRNRRGFDSLVQMSSGIADAGMAWKHAEKPLPLPVQALDHATGYLMAASALRALSERLQSGRGGSARLSLARTEKLLVAAGPMPEQPGLRAEQPSDQGLLVEQTAWGQAHRLLAPVSISGTPLQWDLPAGELGSYRARW